MSKSFEQVKKVKIEFEDGSVSVCTLFGKNNLIFEQLSDEIKQLKSLTEWQPIETAPKDGTHIIVIEPVRNFNGGVTGAFWRKEEQKMFDGETITLKGFWAESRHDQVVCNPTHWMPLPNPPAN